ncbi:arginase family protein [Corallococcus macrosporus]|uniref:Arginase/agmatinase/formiminoglutamase n=1 Tax=Corallococcus macrosporus DSM 14697 TaxID=1189310 RepID=A0A250JWV5_9BACT|nr:arginase family protein [Corallococcus macrosporus]ATB48344.1 arginase/agmatinase/formiminoglutamase [Corallococcus macrosporus DSM 14697]
MRNPDSSVDAPDSPAGWGDLSTIRLVLSDDLILESQDATHVTVANTATAARMKLSTAAYQFLKAFAKPRRLEEVVPPGAAAGARAQVGRLLEKRLLLDADAPRAVRADRLRTTVPYRFCNAPAHGAASDFVVLGVPYDLAGAVDCRAAPTAIRQKSLDYLYRMRIADGRPNGWFDANRETWIMRGASLADAGDVYVEYGEEQAELFGRIASVLGTLGEGAVPVVLGGDGSVTYAVAAALRRRGPLTVVRLSAELATSPASGAEVIGAEEVAARLLELEGVERFVSLGGLKPPPASPSGRVTVYDVEALRRAPLDTLACDWGGDVHLSIDLGLTTPECMRTDEHGVSAGLSQAELRGVISALGQRHRIVGIDLVGLDTRSRLAHLSAAVACDLALTAMEASRGHGGAER